MSTSTKTLQLTVADRAEGAFLWSGRRAVVAGAATSSLHGATWVLPGDPIELICHSSRPQRGLLVRDERIADDEIVDIGGLPVASVPRTAFDIGRHLPADKPIARLDALARATGFAPDDVLALIERYSGARGMRTLRAVLPLVDAGAQSPKETWLRLLFYREGLPPPVTQIPVDDDGYVVAYLDLGWPQFKVAVEYDGDRHRKDRRQYVKDIGRRQLLEQLGWIVVYVVAEDSPVVVVHRTVETLRRRGCAEIGVTQRVTRDFPAHRRLRRPVVA